MTIASDSHQLNRYGQFGVLDRPLDVVHFSASPSGFVNSQIAPAARSAIRDAERRCPP